MEIEYHKFGDYYLPNLTIDGETQQPLGKYGRMRKRYLEENHPPLYASWFLSGKLFSHLAEIETVCEERMDFLIRQMSKREGVTETLKAADQMEWVQLMNNIHNRAEEIVISELVYAD
ncbi:MAG: TnpV protein [Oscillospiraceae bacterium]|nr:TnpV protein [Oscillospiraceae bacterium]